MKSNIKIMKSISVGTINNEKNEVCVFAELVLMINKLV